MGITPRTCVWGVWGSPVPRVETDPTAPSVSWGFKGPQKPSQLWLKRPGWGSPSLVGVGKLGQGRPHCDHAPSPPELFITSGPSPGGQAPLRSAGLAQPAAAGAPWGRAAAGEGRSGPALGRRGRGPGLQRGWGGGRKLPVQIRAEVGPAVRQCGMLPPPPASAEPASASPVRTPRAKGLPGGPLLPAWDSAAWAEAPGSSGGWASTCSFSSKP